MPFIKRRYSFKADFKHSINCKFSIACDTSLSKSVENSWINKCNTKTKAGWKTAFAFWGPRHVTRHSWIRQRPRSMGRGHVYSNERSLGSGAVMAEGGATDDATSGRANGGGKQSLFWRSGIPEPEGEPVDFLYGSMSESEQSLRPRSRSPSRSSTTDDGE